MQTHPVVVGLARIGDRFGVRCAKKDEENLHSKLRPTTVWVDRARLRTYERPFGTQRQVISRALVAFGWQKALVEARSATVVDVCQEEVAIELAQPVNWAEGLPFTLLNLTNCGSQHWKKWRKACKLSKLG